MSLNTNLSPKILQYYYNWAIQGNKIIFTNVLDSSKIFQIEYHKKFRKDPSRVIIIENNTILDKKKCIQINKSYRLEQWIYSRVGLEKYNLLHEFIQNKSFYDFLGKKLDPILFEEHNHNCYHLLEELLLEYQKLLICKKETYCFKFLCSRIDFIPFINSLGYALKKEKYTYEIQIPKEQEYKIIKEEIRNKILDYIKYHPESYFNDD